jgi:DNA invertase Pin-like site-specific DNA recombinase
MSPPPTPQPRATVRMDARLDGETRTTLEALAIGFGRSNAAVLRELISLRTQEALAAARAAGKRLGRPRGARGRSTLDGRAQEIPHLLARHVSKAAIAKITGVDRATLYQFIRSRKAGIAGS